MKTLFATLLLLANYDAHAAVRVNNGGGGWACRSSVTLELTNFKLADRFEMEAAGGRMLAFPGMTREQIFADREAAVLRDFPELAELLERHSVDVFRRLMVVPGEIATSPDSRFFARPAATFCDGTPAEYIQIADYIQIGQLEVLKIDSTIWNSPLMTPADQAFLLWHERLYKVFREEFGDWNSGRTRLAGGILFSDEPVARKRARMRTLLGAESSSPQGASVRPGSGIRCYLYVYDGSGRSDDVLTWDGFFAGKPYVRGHRGYLFSLVMDLEYPRSISIERDGRSVLSSRWDLREGASLMLGGAHMYCRDRVF